MRKADVFTSVIKTNTVWFILLLCGLNLLIMHYSFLCADYIESEINITTIVDNLLGITIDVTVLFLISYLLTWRHMKAGLTITFFITLLWSFSNILYSRFFYHYLSISAIGQGGSLFDSEMIRCVLNGLRWTDLYFVLSVIPFSFLIKSARNVKRIIAKFFVVLLIMVSVDVCSFLVYCYLTPEYRYVSYLLHRMKQRQLSIHLYLCNPNNAAFRRGGVRTLSYELVLDYAGTSELTDEQRKLIAQEIEEVREGVSGDQNALSKKNVIFIIVESYMSFTSDKKVNGKEVTPFLNSLKRDSHVYYNGKMHENVTIGESSDGQFIYMTGLLPLRAIITISKARKIILPGLPKKLGKVSRMIIPTVTSLWNQDEMCRQYGFNSLYSSKDHAGSSNLNDEQVIQLAMQKDNETDMPFFSVILTMSMHQPYTKQIDPTFPITDSSIPKDLACYLNACHYTDRQIERYFEHLKQTGLYDNSLIVIAADHSVHNTDFGGVSKNIPLYLVNVPKEIQARMWHGECNQIDVYFTLLDLLGIESDWYGLGQSLLSPDYSNDIDERKWDVSEWIIRDDYFSK
mgnify:CR=1 FL=1